MRLGIVIANMFLYGCCTIVFGQQSPPFSSRSSSRHSLPQKVSQGPGTVINGSYRNSYFQFAYQIPFGWVDRTLDMRGDTETDTSRVLLAIFERPPAASGETVNSAVVIAAESAAAYPGLKNAADYFAPLTNSTESKGFKVVNEPYEFPVDGKLIVRGDFTKERGSVTMHQSSLVMMSRGYVVSFTFVAGSDEDVKKLIEKLSFVRQKS